MSWAAHQFEYYAVQAHLPRKWRGQISFLAVVARDQSCDLVGKVWTYGFTIGGHHYGPTQPSQWHRGFPGLGFSHSIAWALLVGVAVFVFSRSRAWAVGIALGISLHVLTDTFDSVGTMLAFPFSTRTFSFGGWAYAATPSGKYTDAGAYYSSLGLAMDVFWLVVVLLSWRVLTRAYWRENIVTADPRVWAWLGRRLPERALVTLYQSWFIYGVTRLIAWTGWSHVLTDFSWDLRWGGPSWIPRASLSHPDPLAAAIAVVGGLAVVYVMISQALKLLPRVRGKPALTGHELDERRDANGLVELDR